VLKKDSTTQYVVVTITAPVVMSNEIDSYHNYHDIAVWNYNAKKSMSGLPARNKVLW